MILFSPRLWRACINSLFALFLISAAAQSLADAITYIETQQNGINGVAGLSGISDVAVSPDGKFVYTASYASNAVSVFERNPETGQVTYSSTTTGIVNAFSVDVSSDNKSVYVASPGGQTYAYARDLTTGALTPVNSLSGTPTSGFVSVSVSPDSKTVYGVGGNPSGLVVFGRDTETGAITLVADYSDNSNGYLLGQYFGPVTSPIKNIASTADGQFVYVTSTVDNALTLFSRDVTTGALTQLVVYSDGVAGFDGLQGPSSVKISPDGKHLYVTGQGESSVAIFGVDESSGELTYIGKVTNGVDGIANLVGARSLAISPDGRYVLVSAITSDSVTAFSRDAATGLLMLDSVVTNAVNGVAGLDGPSGMATDPLNRHLYVAGQLSHSLVVFSLPTPAVKLSVNTAAAVVSGPAVTLDPQLEVFDSDSPDLVSATITINSGFINTDALVVQATAGIAAAYDTATGVLTLSGVASLADYQAVLRSLSYQAGADPSLSVGDSSTRQISIQVSDGENTSAVVTVTVTVEKTSGFTVTFVDWDNAVLSSQLVASGGAATAPTAPGRTGYGFTGWDLAFDNVTADLTVTAQYSINTYTVTFDLDGGSRTGGGALTQTVDYGLAATAPVFTGPAGTTFTGWSTGFDTVTADLTVTAQYSINSYSVTFNLDGGSRTGGGALTQTVQYGQAATAPVFTAPAGTTFTGWSTSFDAVTADLTVTALYSINTYTVTFNLDGGTQTGGGALVQTVNYGQAATVPVFTAPAGRSFSGWNGSFDNVTANITVTAQYTINTYTVTFDLDGGTSTGGGALVQTVNYGQAAVAPVFTAPSGGTFSGWSTSFDNITANITVTAQYTINTYTVTATVTGEGSVTPATQQIESGSSAIFILALMQAGDYVSLGSNCNASLSGNQIVTAAITADCAITVSVYPSLEVTRDSDEPLGSNVASRFSVTGGTGEKSLTEVLLKRAGEETVLEPADADALISLQTDGSYLFRASRTGRYTLTFVDAVSGESAEVSFDVLPYIAFTSSKQPVQQDVATRLRVWLSDEPIEYPVIVDFVATGTGVAVEQFELTAADNLRRAYEVTAIAETANVSLREEGLTTALVGTPAVHTLAVQQDLPSLALNVTPTQNGQQNAVVNTTDGEVVLNVAELNDATATYTWSSDGLILTPNGASASFDTAMVPEGMYTVTVHATALDGRTGQYDLVLRVVADCPLANCEDTGTSGIPAAVNPLVSMPNRIPVCPDVSGAANRVTSCQTAGAATLYAEVPSQYALSIGELSGDQSWATGQFGIAVNDQALADPGYNHQGITLNFDVVGLEHAGEAVSIAIPLPAGISIPQDAVWRKFINNQWQDFVVDTDNQIHSAARDALGQCPGVSSDVWAEGLIAGRDCVRLTIEDGGPNDADGIANSVIRDPSVLAVALAVEPPDPEPPVDPVVKDVRVKSGGGSVGGISVVLLGLLGLLRSRKIWAAMMMLPLPVLAQNVYLGVDGLAVKTSVSSSDVTGKIAGLGITGTAQVDDSSRNGWRLYGGVELGNAWSLELGWLDMGDITTQFRGVPEETSSGQLVSVSPQSGEGFELGARWQVTDRFGDFKPSLRAGVWLMDVKARYTDDTGRNRKNESDTVPFIGADVQWLLTEQWSTKLGASHYYTEHYGTTTLNLGVVYNF